MAELAPVTEHLGPVMKTRNVPPMKVVVLDGQTVSHNGETYRGRGVDDKSEPDDLVLEGPLALSLMQHGHVQIMGPAE